MFDAIIMKSRFLVLLFLIVFIGFIVPQNLQMPVVNATVHDYNSDSFWYYPWGKSVTHKGVDIFASKGISINSATNGVVLYSGFNDVGGNIVVVLGPKWRIHYYAHLEDIKTKAFSVVTNSSMIGTVGDTGNAAGKQPHLHYSIVSLFPFFWLLDSDRQGWKKMFYLNPIKYFVTTQVN